MPVSESKNDRAKYLYYDYHDGRIAREEIGNDCCAANRFYFYIDGAWVQDYDMSLHLCDAIMNCCGYTFGDYEELTEEEALRRISSRDNT